MHSFQATVSCAAAGLLAAAVAAGPADAMPLSVLTYNVAGLPEGLSGSHPEANHPQIGPLLNAYDLVAVQEDFFYHDLLTPSLTHPYQSVKDESGGTYGVARGDGLNTFSRIPFGDFTRVTWNECFGVLSNGSDCIAPKGFSYERHELAPGVFLDVYNLHTDAGGDPEDLAARAANVRQAYAAIVGRSGDAAVLLLGDTNSRYTRAADVLPEMLSATGLTDVWLELQRGDAMPEVGAALTDCADPSAGSCERVDKIFYRSSVALRIEALAYDVPRALFSDAAGVPLSDHDPVHALFELTIVPEPGTGALVALGLLALARARRAA